MKLTPTAVCRTRASVRLRTGRSMSVHSSTPGPPVARILMPRVIDTSTRRGQESSSPPRPSARGEPPGRDCKVRDDAPADQVLADDPFKVRGRAVAVPGAVRVDDRDGARVAHPQADALGAQDAARAVDEAELAQAPLEVGPGDLARLDARALAAADAE